MRAEDDRQSLEPLASKEPSSAVEARAVRDGNIVQLRVSARSGTPSPERGASSVPPLVRDLLALESVVQSFEERERLVVEALKRSIDALHKEVLTRLIRSLKSSPAAAAALREAVKDELVYGVLRHHELVRPSLQERVEVALESVRPMLAGHGGDVQLVELQPPSKVIVRLLGSCDGCSSAALTLGAGVEAAIKRHCPEIEHVEQAKGLASQPAGVTYVSPFAQAEQAGWREVGKLEDIPEGDVWIAELEGRSLILSRVGERVSCFENACAHLGMPLDQGELRDGVLTCPHHGFQFSMESGECLTVPEVQLQTHAARVSHGLVEVRLA
jgi:nitrite reductase/ring-hydroxylating ferredoxin subunit/Fe-S cluster biogenesis protein NfuA